MVALDWLDGRPGAALRHLAGAARWPGVWRAGTRAHRLNRSAYRLGLDLLRVGRVLLVTKRTPHCERARRLAEIETSVGALSVPPSI
jgi:hypothetical protein